jgi:hypothetical protein
VARHDPAGRALPAARLPPCAPGEYPAHLQERVGKSVKQFFDDILEPEFRNAMAHFAASDGSVLHMSDYSHQLRFADIMLITEQCVRTVIANHEALLAQLD